MINYFQNHSQEIRTLKCLRDDRWRWPINTNVCGLKIRILYSGKESYSHLWVWFNRLSSHLQAHDEKKRFKSRYLDSTKEFVVVLYQEFPILSMFSPESSLKRGEDFNTEASETETTK